MVSYFGFPSALSPSTLRGTLSMVLSGAAVQSFSLLYRFTGCDDSAYVIRSCASEWALRLLPAKVLSWHVSPLFTFTMTLLDVRVLTLGQRTGFLLGLQAPPGLSSDSPYNMHVWQFLRVWKIPVSDSCFKTRTKGSVKIFPLAHTSPSFAPCVLKQHGC